MLKNILIAASLLLSCHDAIAGQLVIFTSIEAQFPAVTMQSIGQLYMAKVIQTEDGKPIQPIHLNPNSREYEIFLQHVVKKRPSEYQRYWAKQMFSGAGLPPTHVFNNRSMIRTILNNSRSIGYIDASQLDGIEGVNILFSLEY